MIEVYYHKKSYSIPESYNELSSDQLIQINKVLLTGEPKSLVRLKLLRVLLNMNLYSFFRLPADCKFRILFPDADTELFYTKIDDEIESSVDWIFNNNNLTDQVLPFYKTFCGPKKEFDNLKVCEFHVCEMAYYDYINTNDVVHLNTLVATLYRPVKNGYDFLKDSEGDARIPFNPNELSYYTSVVSEWPLAVKLSILTFYDGCREFLKELYEEVFVTGESGESGNESAGMYEIIRNLSGPRYGQFKDVEQMNIHDVMREIVSSMAEAEKEKELLNSQA
jgi:hypothetical protein